MKDWSGQWVVNLVKAFYGFYYEPEKKGGLINRKNS